MVSGTEGGGVGRTCDRGVPGASLGSAGEGRGCQRYARASGSGSVWGEAQIPQHPGKVQHVQDVDSMT